MVAEGEPHFEGWLPSPFLVHIEAAPAETARIDRPRARSEHGYGGAQHGQQDVNPLGVPRHGVDGERDPQLVDGYQSARYRRQKTSEQEDTTRRREQIARKGDRFPRRQCQIHNAETNQRDSGAKTQE